MSHHYTSHREGTQKSRIASLTHLQKKQWLAMSKGTPEELRWMLISTPKKELIIGKLARKKRKS